MIDAKEVEKALRIFDSFTGEDTLQELRIKERFIFMKKYFYEIQRHIPFQEYSEGLVRKPVSNNRVQIPPRIKEEVRKRDFYSCRVCSVPLEVGQVHHIIPVCYGGETKTDNLLLLCGRCHNLTMLIESMIKKLVVL